MNDTKEFIARFFFYDALAWFIPQFLLLFLLIRRQSKEVYRYIAQSAICYWVSVAYWYMYLRVLFHAMSALENGQLVAGYSLIGHFSLCFIPVPLLVYGLIPAIKAYKLARGKEGRISSWIYILLFVVLLLVVATCVIDFTWPVEGDLLRAIRANYKGGKIPTW
jgi:hypothetical protein